MKAVLFDLDRTLLDRDVAFVKYAEQIWAKSKIKSGTKKELFVSRFIHLDARGRGDKRAMFQTLVSEFLPDCDADGLHCE
jgi:FMN phosphatase YigB (HAD superfamily)